MVKLDSLLSDRMMKLCQARHSCSQGPPGPPGQPGLRGTKGSQGRRGPRGRRGMKGDDGIMGSPGKSGKQGTMGPRGNKGEPGEKGQSGHPGMNGRPGIKGDPGESISSPVVVISPSTLTINENEVASFQCSANGNPQPVVEWSRKDSVMDSKTKMSAGKIMWKKVAGSDSGIYMCTARNILGKVERSVRLTVNVKPLVSLHLGPTYVRVGSNASLPTCYATGYPRPKMTWSKPLGKLPHSSVQNYHGNSSILKVFSTQMDDTGKYLCTASNILGSTSMQTSLVVVRLPKFTIRPRGAVSLFAGASFTLNCSATGDPQPLISWKRLGGQLPAGWNQLSNGSLAARNVKHEDAGIYMCIATSGGVFEKSSISNIIVPSADAFKDCSTLLNYGYTQSGVYSIDPDGRGQFKAYCDMRTDGGGWTVFQRRRDGSGNFSRGWDDYKAGFGQLTGEFWLGNDKIHRLTASRTCSLRVDMEDWNSAKAYAKYGRFSVGKEQSQYRLEAGSFSGTAGDSLAYHNTMKFSTKDRNNDASSSNYCTRTYTGGWWFKNCHYAYPNGLYLGKSGNVWGGVLWYGFTKKKSLKFIDMKLKPVS